MKYKWTIFGCYIWPLYRHSENWSVLKTRSDFCAVTNIRLYTNYWWPIKSSHHTAASRSIRMPTFWARLDFLTKFSDPLNLFQSNLEEMEVSMDYRIYILIICCLLIVICLALCIAYMKFLKIDCLPKSSKASETSDSDDETKDLVWLAI